MVDLLESVTIAMRIADQINDPHISTIGEDLTKNSSHSDVLEPSVSCLAQFRGRETMGAST
jgi:hypothetical protein